MSPNPSVVAMQEAPVFDVEYVIDSVNMSGGADRTQDYFYLAGPMSNIKAFNFPKFRRIATFLREKGYNICNPAELDHELARMEAEQSPDGSHRRLTYNKTWAECLRRDIDIVADDKCVGVIVMGGWEHSQGAQFETYVAYKLRKPIYLFEDDLDGEDVVLTQINRRAALEAAGVVDG